MLAARPIKAQCFYYEPCAARVLGCGLRGLLRDFAPGPAACPVVVCIGTDRITGDSLGPFVGTLLQERYPGLPVYGTLADPLHGANLGERIASIYREHPGRPVVAVDSALGENGSVGKICVYRGPLQPSSGLNKTLPEIGDVHVIGIVNVGHGNSLDYFALQDVRMHLVWEMAKVILRVVEIGIGVGLLSDVEATVALGAVL